MRLMKPDWVSLDGKPIFSIDIHPDGSRFATGGQGDNSGKVVIWNMAPVRDEQAEKDENIPKLLCQMDNHLGCVNCVRWSCNGRFLASGGDDKLIMIWQTSRHGGMSTTFGSDVANVEQWRVSTTLRGHAGDVLDLAWSANDIWLASCSIDNTVIVWNAQKFPEQVAVLRGHSGMVKGITWDPVGKYLASQSDDRTVRVWRTLDWQEEACIDEPFRECGGTTHVLRLNWSPDGQYLVSAHAMNNSGPTAQIIEREGWSSSLDFVGHRKAITAVRFNPCILSRKLKKESSKSVEFTCCAIGSKDRSLSVWLTALKRPLVVTHDLFSSTVLDITWSQSGTELLCCSWDGTVAYMGFDKHEVGLPLTKEEKLERYRSLYGKTSLLAAPITQVVESVEVFNMQEKQQQQQLQQRLKEEQDNMAADGLKRTTASRPPVPNGNSNSSLSPSKYGNKQIETRTKDGRRRITPIFLAPQPDVGEIPLPFPSSFEPHFSSSKEQSTIIIEKKDSTSPPPTPSRLSGPPVPPSTPLRTPGGASSASMAATPKSSGAESSGKAVTPSTPVFSGEGAATASSYLNTTPQNATMAVKMDKATTAASVDRPSLPKGPPGSVQEDALRKSGLKLGVKRRLDASGQPVIKRGPGRPRKDRNHEAALTAAAAAAAAVVATTPNTQAYAVDRGERSQVVYARSDLSLPVSSISGTLSLQISGTVGSSTGLMLDVASQSLHGVGQLHKLTCHRGGNTMWETATSSKILACAGNSHLACVACEDRTVTMYNANCGRRLYPSLMLDSQASVLQCSGYYVMVITTRGTVFVWDTKSMTSTIKGESLVSIITDNSISLERPLLTEQGLPVLTLSTGQTFTFKTELGCWVLLSSQTDSLQMCSNFSSCKPPSHHGSQGPLATLQAIKQRPGTQSSQMYRLGHHLQQAATLSHLENQMTCCLALKSGSEYNFWLLTYVRYLVQEGLEDKLRDVCSELLGPVYSSKSGAKWETHVLGLSKHGLLQEVLPVVASNLKLQRLFAEFQDQMET